ncbi:hypothetical protein D3C84_1146370 [compost metagenome]
MLLFASLAAHMFQVAEVIGTVNIAILCGSAVVAFAYNDIFVCTVDRHRDTLVEHIAFPVE